MSNVFILTTGQTGSRVLTQAFLNAGWTMDEHAARSLSSVFFDKFVQPYCYLTSDLDKPIRPDHMAEVKAYLDKHDHHVFKSESLIRFAHLHRILSVGLIRHPGEWLQSVARKQKQHRKTPQFYAAFFKQVLALHKSRNFPLFDFSQDFVSDVESYLGPGTCRHWHDRRIRSRNRESAPQEMMDVYSQYTTARLHNANIP